MNGLFGGNELSLLFLSALEVLEKKIGSMTLLFGCDRSRLNSYYLLPFWLEGVFCF